MTITIPPWILWAIVIFAVKFGAAVVITLLKMNNKLGGINESLARGERVFARHENRIERSRRRISRLETTCSMNHGALPALNDDGRR